MKLLFENWREFIEEDKKDKRLLYHIGPRPAEPKPFDAGKEGWRRYWMSKPIRSGVFLTPNPADIAQFHGVSGNVYAYKIPEWAVKKSGGVHRYDHGSEILISDELWEEAGDEIEFLGKSMSQNELWDQTGSGLGGRRMGVPSGKKPGWMTDEEWEEWSKKAGKARGIGGLRATKHPDQAIKLMTPAEREEMMGHFQEEYPEALKGERFEVEWTKPGPGERKGYRKDFRMGEKPIPKQDQVIIDLLRKYIKTTLQINIFENWRKYSKDIYKKYID
tara:strand:+ start:348 stop:1172 length:825 start_codon:yes stop_codon:yes gene_type:complete